jgi:DNA-binding MarR family transcriptional regulator
MNEKDIPQESLPIMDILMWRVIKLFLKNKKQILERLSLTCSQFEILSAIHYLQKFKAGIIQAELSERTGIDPMTTSTILRNLEKKGFITRSRSVVNTRTVEVMLTTNGVELLEKAYQQIRSSSELIYKDVNKKYLASQLAKLSDKLNKLNY